MSSPFTRRSLLRAAGWASGVAGTGVMRLADAELLPLDFDNFTDILLVRAAR